MKTIVLVVMLLLFYYKIISSASADVVINEVDLGSLAAESFEEAFQWVEIYNSGNEDVDISSYAVYPISNSTNDIKIDEGTKVKAKGFFVISSNLWLDSDGDSIVLIDENGVVLDRTPYLRNADSEGCSWSRYPDGGPEWVLVVSSQGYGSSGQLCEEKEVEYVKFSSNQNVHGFGFANAQSSIHSSEGASLNSKEHGSGSYSSENTIGFLSYNQTGSQYIDLRKTNSMNYNRTNFKIGSTQPINFDSRWASETESSEGKSSAKMQVSYRYATNINGGTKIVIGRRSSGIAINSEFKGAAEVKYISPELKSIEDYTGSFKVSENFSKNYSNKTLSNKTYFGFMTARDYEDNFKFLDYITKGSLDRSAASTAGYGFVDVEKQIGDNLRTYEHGTGLYMTDEEIRADKESLVKDIALIHTPVSYSYSPQTSINQSLKWREGIYSNDKDSNYISEDFSDIAQLKKETVANATKAMKTQASFTGKARLRADIREPTGVAIQDDEYHGSYDITRKVAILPELDKPHFSITKKGHVSSQKCDILDYSIAVTNDGNIGLGPIYVKDTFPSGTQLIDTNLVPLELTSRSANWSIHQLDIGKSFTIEAKLKITKRTNSTVNRVRASTSYEEVKSGISRIRRLSASSTSTINLTYDECAPTILSISTSATPDASQSNIITYKLSIENLAKQNMSINATVMLPAGVKFLNSTTKPTSTSDDKISWSISKLIAGKKKSIYFMGEAEDNGFFMVNAQVHGYSLDGEELASENISIPVLIGKYVEYLKLNSSEWLPCCNDTQFMSIGSSNTDTVCCDLWS